ncbi:MAG: ATPase [Muribaculaceae bacterium]|nr:ATPase [Muribaculaceae bacterium]
MRTITLAAMTAVALLGATEARAQYENKVKVQPTGRILLDGAIYAPDGALYEYRNADGELISGPSFADGVALPDIRMGAKVSYGHWQAKIDVGYGYQKLGFKDVYIQYNINPNNYLRGGYFVHQFGLNAATSSSMKPAMESATTDDFFKATGRNVGVEFVHDKDQFFTGVSAIIDGTSMSKPANEQGKVSVGGVTRLVWRPLREEGSIAQVGMSLWYQSALHGLAENGSVTEGYFNYSANFPTRVDKIGMLNAHIGDAKGVFKLSPEVVAAYGRVAIEGQYYYMNIARRNNLESYRAQGAYGLFRSLLIGSAYGYSHGDAGLATPAPKSLELIVGYNYTDASCHKAGIYGGRTNDYSVTLNYYINKYILARLRYSYTDVRDSEVLDFNKCHVNTVQARLQILF